MTLEELLAALGVDGSDENKDAIGQYLEAQTYGIKANRDKFKAEMANALARLKAYEGLDLDDMREAIGADDDIDIADLPDLIRAAKAKSSGDGPKDDARVAELESKLERLQKRWDEDKATLASRESALKASIAKGAVDSAVTAAISEKNGNALLLKPHVSGRIKAEVDEDGRVELVVLTPTGEPMEDKTGAPATVLDLVEEFRNTEHFGAAFAADGTGGTGAREGQRIKTGRNPWSKEHFNLTEQARLSRENPAAAKRLREQANAA